MDINAVTADAYDSVMSWLSDIRRENASDVSIFLAEEELMGLYGKHAVALDDNYYQVLLRKNEPAVRIWGTLSHGDPATAEMQVQYAGAWVQVMGNNANLLSFARLFDYA